MNSIDKIKKSMLHYHQFELTSNRNKNMSDNEMIAQFMGYTRQSDGAFKDENGFWNNFEVFETWNWLMLVVQECKCVKEADYVLIDAIDFSLCNNDLLGVHEAVVKFIKAQKL